MEKKIQLYVKLFIYSWLSLLLMAFTKELVILSSNNIFTRFIDLILIIQTGFVWFIFWSEFEPESIIKRIFKPFLYLILAFNWKDILTVLNDSLKVNDSLFPIIGGTIFILMNIGLYKTIRIYLKMQKIVDTKSEHYQQLSLSEKINEEIAKNNSDTIEDFHRKIKLIETLLNSNNKDDTLEQKLLRKENEIRTLNNIFLQIKSNLEKIKKNKDFDESILSISQNNYNKIKIIIQNELNEFNKLTELSLKNNQLTIEKRLSIMDELSLIISK